MRKYFVTTLAYLLVFIMAFACSANAMTLTPVVGGYAVSGVLDNPHAGKIVTIKVADSDGDILFTRQKETGNDGSYEFVFDITQAGDAFVTVSEAGVIKGPVSFYKSSPEEIARALARLNASSSIATIASDATSSPYGEDAAVFKVLPISLDEFITYNSTGLFAKIIDNMQYSSTEELIANYNVGKFLVECDSAASSSDLLSVMKGYELAFDSAAQQQYASYLVHRDKKIASVYKAYTDDVKKQVLGAVSGKAFESFKAFYDALYDAVITKELNSIHNYSEKYTYAEKYNDTLCLDLAKYQSLGDWFDDFKQDAFSQTISNIADLISKCETAYSTYYPNPPVVPEIGKDNISENKGSSSHISVGGLSGSVTSPTQPVTPVQPASMFDDIADYAWASEAITELAKKGVISGKSTGIFAPADNITRAEFVKILVGALNIASNNSASEFGDVASDHWAHSYVSAATGAGIVNGIGDGSFGAGFTITRQDMAVMCYRALSVLGVEFDETLTKDFADASSIADYAKDAVALLGGAGIINGRGDNSFCPAELLTRAEAAKIIYSLTEVI